MHRISELNKTSCPNTNLPEYTVGHFLLFSSPEHGAHGELLWSVSVRRLSCCVNNCFKSLLLLHPWAN